MHPGRGENMYVEERLVEVRKNWQVYLSLWKGWDWVVWEGGKKRDWAESTILPEKSSDKGFNVTLLLTFMCLCLDQAGKKLVLMFCFNLNILLHGCQVTVQADQEQGKAGSLILQVLTFSSYQALRGSQHCQDEVCQGLFHAVSVYIGSTFWVWRFMFSITQLSTVGILFQVSKRGKSTNTLLELCHIC